MKIVLQNILRDKKRTITILAAVILMVSAMSSLGNLFYGIRNCQSEYARSCNGYYEYSYRGKRENLELIRDSGTDLSVLTKKQAILSNAVGPLRLKSKYYFNGQMVGWGMQYERSIMTSLLTTPTL